MPDSNIQNSQAHFVPLSAIMDQYAGQLLDYMQEHEACNVVITLKVKIDIAGKKKQPFFVAVGVTFDFETPEALVDEAQRQCPHNHDCLFAWVPAHLYGSVDFGIAIDEIGVGENLQNGLVGEVIDKAAVEHAVTALAAS
jgi:uncharacterized repeat protein (TIGR04076 family)